MRRRWVWAAVTILAVVSITDARADRIKQRQKVSGAKKSNIRVKIGFEGGGIGGGPVTIKGFRQFHTSSSYSLGLYFEDRRPRRLRLTAAFDIYDVRFRELSWAQKNLLVGSLELKFPMKRAEPKLAIQPGIGVGMGYLGPKEYYFVETEKCYFLMLKFFGELLYYYTPKHGFVMELGLLYAPTGTSEESRTRIWGGPMFVYRAGFFL